MAKKQENASEGLDERMTFQSDNAKASYDKNKKLAEYLDGIWADLDIISIERIEKDEHGWQAKFCG